MQAHSEPYELMADEMLRIMQIRKLTNQLPRFIDNDVIDENSVRCHFAPIVLPKVNVYVVTLFIAI